MSAECYWCKTKTAPGSVPSPVGQRGEPIGICLKCHILACGEHAVRDNLKQEFKCYDCLFVKLLASSVVKANFSESDKEILEDWDITFAIVFQQSDDIYKNFEEFKVGNPQLADLTSEVSNNSIDFDLWPFQVQNILKKISDDGEKFLIVAAHLLDMVEGANNISEIRNVLKYYLVNIIHNTILRE